MRVFTNRAVALAAATLGIGLSEAGAQDVRFADLGINADGPVYIAIEKGYFRDAGINVILERFNSAAQAIAPLSTNQVQVAGGAVSAALFNAFARGWEVRIAFSRVGGRPGFSGDTLSVRSDLEVNSAKDLKGRKLAINVPGSGLQYFVGKLLEKEGLGLKDVEVVYMPWANMGSAFSTKAIEAGALVEPFVAQYADRAQAVPFTRASDVLGAVESSVILYNTEWATKKADQANAFAVGYIRGARDYYDAMKRGPLRKEVVSILTKNTQLKDPALYDKMQWGYVEPNGEVNVDSLRDQQEWHARNGNIPKKVDVESMIDRRYLDYAIKKLGKLEAQ